MKVVTSKEISRIEKKAYSSGASEEKFMWNAATAISQVAHQMIASYHLKPSVILLCGRGNNGGDAFATGILLMEGGFAATAYAPYPESNCSPLNVKMRKKFLAEGGKIVSFEKEKSHLDRKELVIDGLLGTGFHGDVESPLKELIEWVNCFNCKVLSVDIPSGVNGDSGEVGKSAILATETLFLGLPKIGAFFEEAWEFTGKVHVRNFGLDDALINEAQADYLLLDQENIFPLLPKIHRTRHKYEAGYVVGIGGSPGLCGAASMAAYSSLRVGAGIVRLFHPKGTESEFLNASVEIVKQQYGPGELSAIEEEQKRAASFFLGPGVGLNKLYQDDLIKILQFLKKPCVIDAGALHTISENPSLIPKNSVITPHAGELSRLLKSTAKLSKKEMILQAQEFVKNHPCVLILKGSPTFIISSEEKTSICPRGDPGMATAGSGDILTGMIAGLIAQGLSPLNGAKLGVFLHGLAGEFAAERLTSYSVLAHDLAKYLPLAFKQLMSTQKEEL